MKLRVLATLVAALVLTVGCSSLEWWKDSDQYHTENHIMAVGKASDPADPAAGLRQAIKDGRQNIRAKMLEEVEAFTKFWKKKTSLPAPFMDNKFQESFLSTQVEASTMKTKHREGDTVYVLMVRDLDAFYGTLRTDAMKYISDKNTLSKQKETEWSIKAKTLVSQRIKNRNKKSNLKVTSQGVEAK